MARYEVIALAADGNSGEGPFYYVAPDPESAIQQYIEWATNTYSLTPHEGPQTEALSRDWLPYPRLSLTMVG